MKSKTTATLLLFLTFLLGGIAGAVGYYLFDSQVLASGRRPSSRSSPHDIVSEMGKGLNLDADQKAKLQVIINQSRDHYKALSQQFRPQYEVIRNETRQEIRQILNDEQKIRFEQKVKEIDERHKNHNHKGPQ